MNKIIEYKIVTRSFQVDFITEINELIKLGYQPYGNPIIYGNSLLQAMVKYENTINNPS